MGPDQNRDAPSGCEGGNLRGGERGSKWWWTTTDRRGGEPVGAARLQRTCGARVTGAGGRRMAANPLSFNASPGHFIRIPMPTFSFPRGLVRLPVLLAAALLLCVIAPSEARAQDHAHRGHAQTATKRVRHPTPRPGITAERVLSPDSVPERSSEVYTMAARIPSVLDGLYCHCDCHERDDKRSLLECFEDEMGSSCGICAGQAQLAYELHQQGKSLREIRKAVDARYGG
jgi:hypothetical protein